MVRIAPEREKKSQHKRGSLVPVGSSNKFLSVKTAPDGRYSLDILGSKENNIKCLLF